MGELILYSEQAKRFKEKYELELCKPYVLEFDETLMGQCEETATHFIIRLDPTLASKSQDAHDSNFCHELYHAVQTSRGYPLHFVHKTNIIEFGHIFMQRLRSNLFDKDVIDTLHAHGINTSYFADGWLKKVHDLADIKFKGIADDISQNDFVMDLLLTFFYNPKTKTKNIMKSVKRCLPKTFKIVHDLQNIVVEHGCSTPHEAFTSLGFIFSRLSLWILAGIEYRGIEITDMDKFHDLLQSPV